MATLYGIKACDTCRKALKAIDGVVFVDVRADGVSDALLDRAIDQFGIALVNTRSTTWRQMDAQARELETAELLKSNPTVMKRPLIEVSGKLFLGWNKEIQAKIQALD